MTTSNHKYIKQQMRAERRLTEIYRKTGNSYRMNFEVSKGGQLVPISKPRTPSAPSRPRSVVHLKLGEGPPKSYNKGFGYYGRMQARAMATAGRQSFAVQARFALRLNPYLRAALNAFDVWNWMIERKMTPSPIIYDMPPTGGGPGWICGGPWPEFRAKSGTNTPRCGLMNQAMGTNITTFPLNGMITYNFYDTRVGLPYDPAVHGHLKGQYTIRGKSGAAVPKIALRAAAGLHVPLLVAPKPYWMAKTKTSPSYQKPPPPRPPEVPVISKPPGRYVHERKGELSAALGKAVQVAFAATEAIDAVESLWDALPDHIKAKTAKSGRTRPGALVGEGVAYSTALDKANALFKHYREINLSEAARNLLINHLVDKIIGTMSGRGADELRKRLGASGWGFII